MRIFKTLHTSSGPVPHVRTLSISLRYIEQLDRGETVISDHSRVDWEIPGGTDKKRPIPTELDTLSDATGLTYANKIDVIGDIGPDLMGVL